MKVERKVFPFIVFFLSLSILTFGQKKVEVYAPLSGIPVEQQSALIDRINSFTEAQKNGLWDKVADLMGEYRNIHLKIKYTDKQKECIIEQIKISPIVSYTITGSMISTAVYNYPKENWWYFLQGIAEVKTDSGIITQKTNLGVYRNNQNWFISPPNYGEQWLQRNYRKDTSPEKLNAFLQVVEQPDSPLEISDVSVKRNSKDASMRDFTFKIRNKSQKEVAYFIYDIKTNSPYISGGRSSNNPKTIMPNEIVNLEDEDQRFGAYDYYCQEEQVRKIYIRWVRFTDGSEWKIDKHLSKSFSVFSPNVKQAVSLVKQTNSLFYAIFKMSFYFC